MKIGILTQPLYSNYGGLLQAWALQRTLVNMGHEAIIINRVWHKQPLPLWHRVLSFLKNELYIALGWRERRVRVTEELRAISEQHVRKFREKRYRGISPEIRTDEELLDYIKRSNFDGYVVGSDQVWRPIYSPNLMTYFLDFAKDNNEVKKIAYAASFGVDNWEFSEGQTRQAAELALLFDLITVRESSGVRLVEKYFKCKATHVLDPTMLINKEDYLKLIDNPTCDLKKSGGDLFCYVLDKSREIADVIELSSARTGLRPYYCNYITPLHQIENMNKIEDCVVPPVEQWLKSFVDAKMVVTDSFHGVIFSIIFNKQFWVITNKERGAARFDSLLKQFDLENRIITNQYEIDWVASIDWEKINTTRSKLAEFSKSVLRSELNLLLE